MKAEIATYTNETDVGWKGYITTTDYIIFEHLDGTQVVWDKENKVIL